MATQDDIGFAAPAMRGCAQQPARSMNLLLMILFGRRRERWSEY